MRRIHAGILALSLILLLFAGGAAKGENAGRAEKKPEELIGEILEEQVRGSGAETLQDWINAGLSETADGTGGWYLIALRRLEKLGMLEEQQDFTGARAALEKKAAGEQGSITKRERMALTLQALNSGNEFIEETAARGADEETLMPLVFALHLMNNGGEKWAEARERTAERLLELQLEDGGWAVIGEECDPDCTAMTLQALAPLREKAETARAIERGLEALAGIQQENGGYLGMGMESAESCAQVLTALSCLGIDAAEDSRFLKNGASVLDAMMRFRIPGEGFAHDLKTGRKNDTATVQCLYALVSYENMRRGGGPYYVFGFEPLKTGNGLSLRNIPVRGWLYAGTGLLVAAAWAAALIRKKRNWRSYAFPLLAGAVLAAGIAWIRIQSPEGFYGEGLETDAGRNVSTFLSIRCDTVAGENEYTPADGVILAEEEVLTAEGESAFDQLMTAARKHRIQLDFDGTAAGTYVRGIAHIYEYDFGTLSGWMYRVNGVYADVGCSQYPLREGDRVEWFYTRNIGRD